MVKTHPHPIGKISSPESSREGKGIDPGVAAIGIGIGGALIAGVILYGMGRSAEDKMLKPERKVVSTWLAGKGPKVIPGIVIINPGTNIRKTPDAINPETDGDPGNFAFKVKDNPVVVTDPVDTGYGWIGFSDPTNPIDKKAFAKLSADEKIQTLADNMVYVSTNPDFVDIDLYSNPRRHLESQLLTGHVDRKGEIHDKSDVLVAHAETVGPETAKILASTLEPQA